MTVSKPMSERRLSKAPGKRYCLALVCVVLLLVALAETNRRVSSSLYTMFTSNHMYVKGNGTKFNSKALTPAYNMTLPERNAQTPKTMISHVRFLKVFKAGSTTVQNMLFRFALRHDLNVLLPLVGNHIYDKRMVVSIPAPAHYDIFAIHTKYSKPWFDSILPQDSVNIAIVRDPAERMISAAYYYREVYPQPYLYRIPKLTFIHQLVQQPEKYDPAKFSKTRNSMAYDFGFPANLAITDTDKIAKYLDFLNKEFKFVMIMEHFETSLVILRRVLNWSLEDIIFLPGNSHSHQMALLEPKEIEKLRKTCFLDYAVYDFFLKRFEERVQVEGPSLKEEVANFNITLQKVSLFCNDNTTKDSLQIEPTKWNQEFSISRKECTLLKTVEIRFIDQIRQRHKQKYQTSRTRGLLEYGKMMADFLLDLFQSSPS